MKPKSLYRHTAWTSSLYIDSTGCKMSILTITGIRSIGKTVSIISFKMNSLSWVLPFRTCNKVNQCHKSALILEEEEVQEK
jgi:hypothetical protein